MAAFITNFQSPVELNDLVDRFENDRMTNIDHILHYGETFGEWTVDKNSQIRDTVFLCAQRALKNIWVMCALK